ncbi:hypothetical protein ACOZ38_16555 [Sphaerisporangium viridialbum]|uniref:hypothetical protein n=1 Tax=Sphaerisporangium viridialbum TaxID=46189 RepID=UPI003C720E62
MTGSRSQIRMEATCKAHGSPCRSRSGAVAGNYHTGRFTKVPRLAELLRVPTPADRGPGQPWRPGAARQIKAHAPHCRVVFTVYEMKRLGRDAAELTALARETTPTWRDI